MSDNGNGHFWDSLLTFMAGAATGFIVGILFAPGERQGDAEEDQGPGRQDRRSGQGKLREDRQGGREEHPPGQGKDGRERRRHPRFHREEAGRIQEQGGRGKVGRRERSAPALRSAALRPPSREPIVP